jgi:hypothetical protein
MRPDDWPVFLIGCHRSGTTLAHYLLDAHPHLACPPESKFLAGVQALVDYPQAANALYTLTWNRLDYTKHCLETLRAQAGYPYDHIILDNGSSDGTVEWLRRPDFHAVVRYPVNAGISRAGADRRAVGEAPSRYSPRPQPARPRKS